MLLDLMMPVLSGFELLEMVEDGDLDLADVAVFVVSAFNVPLRRRRSTAASSAASEAVRSRRAFCRQSGIGCATRRRCRTWDTDARADSDR